MHCLFKRHKTRMGRIPTITDVVSNLDEEEFVECKADEILDHPYGRVQLVRHCASEPSSGVISFIEEIMIFKDAVAEVRGWMAPRMAKKYLREPHLVAKVVPQDVKEAIQHKVFALTRSKTDLSTTGLLASEQTEPEIDQDNSNNDDVIASSPPSSPRSGLNLDAEMFADAKQSALEWLDVHVIPKFWASANYYKFLRFRFREKQPPTLADFEIMRCLGIGAFGKVNAVTKLSTGNIYALKALSKQMLLERRMGHVVVRERRFLSQLRSPFLVNLHFAFQTDTNLYLVMDPMLGGDLAYQLQREKFSDRKVRFYAAELVLAIGYMHANHVIHRDIKPNNIMFDSEGHLHVTDLGLAHTCKPDQRIKGQAGTRSYMSPETMFENWTSWSSDWWAVGIVLFEMITGSHPFLTGHNDTQETLAERIKQGRLDFRDADVSSSLKALISQLLTFDYTKRLGSTGDCEEVKQHQLFAKVNWSEVEAKKIKPPFVPPAGANVTGVHDFEDLMSGRKSKPTSMDMEDSPFDDFDYVNVDLFRKEYFSVARLDIA